MENKTTSEKLNNLYNDCKTSYANLHGRLMSIIKLHEEDYDDFDGYINNDMIQACDDGYINTFAKLGRDIMYCEVQECNVNRKGKIDHMTIIENVNGGTGDYWWGVDIDLADSKNAKLLIGTLEIYINQGEEFFIYDGMAELIKEAINDYKSKLQSLYGYYHELENKYFESNKSIEIPYIRIYKIPSSMRGSHAEIFGGDELVKNKHGIFLDCYDSLHRLSFDYWSLEDIRNLCFAFEKQLP